MYDRTLLPLDCRSTRDALRTPLTAEDVRHILNNLTVVNRPLDRSSVGTIPIPTEVTIPRTLRATNGPEDDRGHAVAAVNFALQGTALRPTMRADELDQDQGPSRWLNAIHEWLHKHGFRVRVFLVSPLTQPFPAERAFVQLLDEVFIGTHGDGSAWYQWRPHVGPTQTSGPPTGTAVLAIADNPHAPLYSSAMDAVDAVLHQHGHRKHPAINPSQLMRPLFDLHFVQAVLACHLLRFAHLLARPVYAVDVAGAGNTTVAFLVWGYDRVCQAVLRVGQKWYIQTNEVLEPVLSVEGGFALRIHTPTVSMDVASVMARVTVTLFTNRGYDSFATLTGVSLGGQVSALRAYIQARGFTVDDANPADLGQYPSTGWIVYTAYAAWALFQGDTGDWRLVQPDGQMDVLQSLEHSVHDPEGSVLVIRSAGTGLGGGGVGGASGASPPGGPVTPLRGWNLLPSLPPNPFVPTVGPLVIGPAPGTEGVLALGPLEPLPQSPFAPFTWVERGPGPSITRKPRTSWTHGPPRSRVSDIEDVASFADHVLSSVRAQADHDVFVMHGPGASRFYVYSVASLAVLRILDQRQVVLYIVDPNHRITGISRSHPWRLFTQQYGRVTATMLVEYGRAIAGGCT